MSGENFSFVMFIIRIIRYLKRRFILLSLSLILGLIIGIVQYFVMKDFSVISFDLKNNSIPKLEIIKDINSFKYYLKNDSIDYLTANYNIEKELIRKIKQIDGDTIKQNYTKIRLQSYDPVFAKNFPSIYVNYLHNKAVLNDKIEKERIKYEKYLEHINAKIKILDSIQANLLLSNNIYSNEYKNQGGTFNEFIYLYDKKIELISKIENYSNVELASFVSIENGKKSLFTIVIQYSILFLFIGLLISLVLEIKRLIKNYKEI